MQIELNYKILKSQDNMIQTTTSDTDLVLSIGTGGIKVLDNMTLTSTPAIDDALADPRSCRRIKTLCKDVRNRWYWFVFPNMLILLPGEIISRKNVPTIEHVILRKEKIWPRIPSNSKYRYKLTSCPRRQIHAVLTIMVCNTETPIQFAQEHGLSKF